MTMRARFSAADGTAPSDSGPSDSGPWSLARFAAVLSLLALASCVARNGQTYDGGQVPRPVQDLRMPAEDGLILAVIGTGIQGAWTDAAPGVRARLDEQRWERARQELGARADLLTYASGGLRVGAALVRPELVSGRRMPVVILCRDGLGGDAMSLDALLVELEGWSREGYVAIASLYRGHRMSQGSDERGAPADVLALLPLVKELGYADPERIYLLGQGHGAERVVRTLAASSVVRAAAIVGAPLAAQPTPTGIAGVPDLDGLDEPLLVVHGDRDRRAPLARARTLTDALTAADRAPELFVVEDGDETLVRHAREVDEQVASWFAAHGGRSLVN
ncbi:MAG: hypothetical protein R3F49_24680 [Planctomycetota bacterium]